MPAAVHLPDRAFSTVCTPSCSFVIVAVWAGLFVRVRVRVRVCVRVRVRVRVHVRVRVRGCVGGCMCKDGDRTGGW